MTTILLTADDLALLRDGGIIERIGGPTIKIMLESEPQPAPAPDSPIQKRP